MTDPKAGPTTEAGRTLDGATSFGLRPLIIQVEREAVDVERLGMVIYEMGIDDLDLPDARKLAAHILARLQHSEPAA